MPLAGGAGMMPPLPRPVSRKATRVDQYVAAEGDDAVLPTRDHEPTRDNEAELDPNLRSLNDVRGYYIAATDGDIGHTADFFAGENDWVIRYIDWVTHVDWPARKIMVKVDRQQVQESLAYDPKATLDRVYEERLNEHYHLPR